MAGFLRLTPEILVNTTTIYGQFGPAIALETNGNILVTWTDFSTGYWDIQGQVLSSTGATKGPQIQITNNSININHFNFSATASSVAGLSDGNVLVTWTDNTLHFGSSSQSDILGQIFSPSGTAVSSTFQISPTNNELNNNSHSSTLSNGNFVVTWFDQSSLVGNIDLHAKFRVFNADGTPVSGVNTFEPSATRSGVPTITGLANGQFVIIVSETATVDSGLFCQVYNADGATSGSVFKINTSASGSFGTNESHVTQLTNGQLVVTWSTVDFVGSVASTTLHGQIVGIDGSKSGGEFAVTVQTGGGSIQAFPDVTALADGRFIVSWSSWDGTLGETSNAGIHAQIYLANGEKTGAEFLVNINTLNAQTNSHVVAMPDGKFAVTYVDDSANPGPSSGSDIRLQIFDPTTYFASGTGEKYTGGNFEDLIVAGAGFDTLTGGLGNDSFVFNITDLAAGQVDTITDFTHDAVGAGDTIRLVGVNATNVSVAASGANAVISYGNGVINDTITAQSAGNNPLYLFGYASEANALSGNKANGFLFVSDAMNEASHTWSKYIQFFDNNGATDYQNTTNDDSTRAYLNLDNLGNEVWANYTENYSANNALMNRTVIYDDNSQYRTYLDHQANQPWAQYVESFDSQGRLDYRAVTNDNGSLYVTHLDRFGNQPWSQYVETFDPQGRLDYRVTNNDNGSLYVTHNDHNNNLSWSTYIDIYDTQSRNTFEQFNYDNGSRDDITIDALNQQSWARDVYSYSAASVLTQHYHVMDDGSIVVL